MAQSVPDPATFNIVMVASEAVPFAKTGGLADVAGALPRELARLGCRVRLILPRYGSIDGAAHGLAAWTALSLRTTTGMRQVTIERTQLEDAAVPASRRVEVLAVRDDPSFGRPGLYQERGVDYPDNLDRFTLFNRAVMELLPALIGQGGAAPILHLHDWQAALSAVYLRTVYDRPGLHSVGTLFTVHNLGYQGLFPASEFFKTGLPTSHFTPSGLEYHGRVNLLKGGLVFSDLLSTVSPSYSREIQTPEYGCGLEGVLVERRDRLAGVVNGIDVDVWNPESDPYLAASYSMSDLSGKARCKEALQAELGLAVKDVPMLGLVSRFATQKGIDLVAEILPDLMACDLQLVLLGTGDPDSERRFREMAEAYPGKLAVRIGFDEGLAHRIEAGSDLFLMPSRYEPCGLSQLYSLRYGTVPIVRRTGGLIDTVVPYTPRTAQDGTATGFRFGEAAGEDLLSTVLLALQIYRDRAGWERLMRAGMRTDVSWRHSATEYLNLYERVVRMRRGSTAGSVGHA